MLEPWAEAYDIPVGKEARLHCDLKEGEIDFEINVEKDNFLALWVPSGTTILLDGQPMVRLLGDELG